MASPLTLVPDTGVAHAEVEVELELRPFSFTIRRRGRSLLRAGGAWTAEGTAHDVLLQFTEGVVPSEQRSEARHAVHARVIDRRERGLTLALLHRGADTGTLDIDLPGRDRVSLRLGADGAPLRLGLDWERRAEERLVGLGLRHHPRLDQAGREIQLGADRRYTGPDCPAEMIAEGGIPQGDCAPVPWLLSSRGYGVWCRTFANGTRFDLAGERISVSTRAHAGPLELEVLCPPTPAGALRELCRLTGRPALLPEWGYGFWKSRDVHEHQDDVLDDFLGFRRHHIPLDAIVIDSPWATQYNTWEFNPHQFPDAPWMIRSMRRAGVRTVVWVTPWVNLDSRDGQIAPQPESEALHAAPASNYAPGAAAGHFVTEPNGTPYVAQWWMGTGSPVDFTSPAAERWWREQTKRVLALGVAGIKADDGDGYYIPDRVRLADGRSGGEAAWELGTLHRRCLQRSLDEVHPDEGVLFGRSGWSAQHALGHTWGGDQVSDFWSLRMLLVAALSGACTAISNFSHDIGGYLGHRLVERCPPELLIRWLQFGCFTPLMHAHSRMPQEPWTYGEDVLALYRAYVLLHERLVPYTRAAAATAQRSGLPIIRPLCLTDPGDPRGWTLTDAYGYGPALWIAPVLEDGARKREVALPRGDWIETWSGQTVRGGQEVSAPAPLERVPVWVRAGSIVVTYPAAHVADGLGDVPEGERPLEATLWGAPRLNRTAVRLADGTRVGWREGRWELPPGREVTVSQHPRRLSAPRASYPRRVHFTELTAPEQRVLGCLIEKRFTTPDQYPLSLNALRLACNQSTNRDPVTALDEDTVYQAAQRLCQYGLARLASGHSSRATKYRHLGEEGLGLDRSQLAVLCVMLLRGPQTPGELKGRTERMVALESLAEVERVLGELAQRGYAVGIGRRPGQKEDRYSQLLGGPAVGADTGGAGGGGDPRASPAPAPAPASRAPGPTPALFAPAPTPAAASSSAASTVDPELERRLAALEDEVATLRTQLAELLG